MSAPSSFAGRRRLSTLAVASLIAMAVMSWLVHPGGVATIDDDPTANGAADSAAVSAPSRGLVFSSFVGGRFWDEATDVKVDPAGNTLVAGFTLSANLPVRRAAQPTFGGLSDAFVMKLAPGGSRVLWSTYLGGRDLDVANGLSVDRAGNIYVTGRTASVDFPTTRGAVQRAIRGRGCQGVPCHDAFVTKLNPSGRVVYSTYLGGSANEEGVSIAVDRAGSAHVSGNTDSRDFPVRAAAQRTFGSPPCAGDSPCPYDVFVTKLSSDGRALQYSTYLGGDAIDTSGSIAIGPTGSAYVTGTTRSPNFPTTAKAVRSRLKGVACGPPPGAPCLDAFITKFTLRGTRLAYSTLLGGTKNDRGSGIAVDARGSAVVTGSTQSTNFPTRRPIQAALDNKSCTAGEPQEQCNDGFVTKLAPSGRSLRYSTYLGGKAEDQGLSVAIDRRGNTYVGGRTDSANFPVRSAVQPSFGGYIDGFASSFKRTGRLRWSTFMGGVKADRVEGVSVDSRQRVSLAGRTLSPDFPTERPRQPVLQHAEEYDAFVAIIR